MTDRLAGPAAVYITVGRAGEPGKGYAWRMWAHRSSFYLRSAAPGLRQWKLSVHGDDPRHPTGGGFKFGLDDHQPGSDRVYQVNSGDWPRWFPGRRLTENAVLVARLRWTADACRRLAAPPAVGVLKRGAVGWAVPTPVQPGAATDVDLIVSAGRPYWHQELWARPATARLPALMNTSGLWLTGTAMGRRATHDPPPEMAIHQPRPRTRGDEIRGLGAAVGDDGVLWLVEQRMSRGALADQSGGDEADGL